MQKPQESLAYLHRTWWRANHEIERQVRAAQTEVVTYAQHRQKQTLWHMFLLVFAIREVPAEVTVVLGRVVL